MVQNNLILRHKINHFPTSSGVSKWVIDQANKRVQRSTRVEQAVQGKQVSEPCEHSYEQTSEWPCTYVLTHGSFEPQWTVFVCPSDYLYEYPITPITSHHSQFHEIYHSNATLFCSWISEHTIIDETFSYKTKLFWNSVFLSHLIAN